mgnify:CR=1 FL=1
MGKSTKYPAYSGGSISINGREIASHYNDGGNIKSSYNMSDTERNIYDSVQNNLSDSLSNLFNISDNQRIEWQNQLNALKNQGMQNINDIYTPMQNNLKNDIASRFGSLDNSVFLDKLNTIVNNKAKAVADLSNNLALEQNNLYTQEIQNRINLINMLDSLNNSFNSRIMEYLNMAKGNSSAGNQYNQSTYKNNQSNSWLNTYSQLQNAGLAAAKIALL